MKGKFKLIHGDCIEVIPNRKEKFDLVFADPPFNINQQYTGFIDKWKDEISYINFTYKWVLACWRIALKSNGIMCLHGPDKLADIYNDIARDHKFRQNRIAWVNWHYRFGQCQYSNWVDSRCHCMVFAKNPESYTWNPDDVLVPSDRSTTYGDKRINETARGGKRLPFTVWGVQGDGPYWGRVQGNSGERRFSHPNQLPEVYLARIVKAYTNEGDYVLDPFCGSGTTPTVAVALGRNCMGIDISEASINSARKRIKSGTARSL